MARPPKPEPKYFLRDNTSLIDYRTRIFSEAPISMGYLGEKSTSYYESSLCASRIKEVAPDAMIIAMLRDPVERALSNYFFSVSNGFENRSLKEVFLDMQSAPACPRGVSVNPFDYLRRGEYLKLLKPYKEKFGERLHLVISERFLQEEDYRMDLFHRLNLDGSISAAPMRANVGTSMSQEALEDVRAYLRNYYKSMVDQLAVEFEINLSQWLNFSKI